MSLQFKALQWSLAIHALVFLGIMFLSRNLSHPDKTVRIDFSLTCGWTPAGSFGLFSSGPGRVRRTSGQLEPQAAKRSGAKVEKSPPVVDKPEILTPRPPAVKSRRKPEPEKPSPPESRVKTRPKSVPEKIPTPETRQQSRPKPAAEQIAAATIEPSKKPVPVSKTKEKPESQPPAATTTAVSAGTGSADSSHAPSLTDARVSDTPASESIPQTRGAQNERYEAVGNAGAGFARLSTDGGGVGPGPGLSHDELAKGSYLRAHFEYIRTLVMNKLQYPTIARMKGWSGRLKLSFTVDKDGQVHDIRIITGTGYRILDRNAVETVKQIAPLPAPPVVAEIIMPISYRLE